MHDESACFVWIPELGSFESMFHALSTDDKRQLILADVAGLPVGHVPREIAQIFRRSWMMGELFFLNHEENLFVVPSHGRNKMKVVIEFTYHAAI